jgi:hypothetical protein
MSLTELANKFGSDKGTQIGDKHGYTLIYEMLFHAMRDNAIRFLELGLQIGGPEEPGVTKDRRVSAVPSVKMWLEYFRMAQIVGFDISDFSCFESDRFTFIRGDLASEHDLKRLAKCGPFDVVVDDGSHASYHQQLAFSLLFPCLSSRGIYVIEDLHWQPAHYEQAFPATKTKLIFERFVAERSFKSCDGPLRRMRKVHTDQIAGVLIIRDPSSQQSKAIIVQKCPFTTKLFMADACLTVPLPGE